MNPYYEHIRKACIKANPKILDLVIGCEVIVTTYDNFGHPDERKGIVVKDLRASDHLPMLVDSGDQLEFYVDPDEKAEVKSLGRPITLQDVLLALGDRYAIDGIGFFMSIQKRGWDVCKYENNKLVQADITKPLSEQSDEVLEWISKQLS